MLSIFTLEIEQDCQNKRLWEEVFFYFDVEGTELFLNLFTGVITRFRIHLMTLEIHVRRFLVDPIPYFHEMDRVIYEGSGDTSSYCHISCVQVHVTALDALNTESS